MNGEDRSRLFWSLESARTPRRQTDGPESFIHAFIGESYLTCLNHKTAVAALTQTRTRLDQSAAAIFGTSHAPNRCSKGMYEGGMTLFVTIRRRQKVAPHAKKFEALFTAF